MEWQHWVMIVMFAGSAILPVAGVVAAYRDARERSREYIAAAPEIPVEGMTFGQFTVVTTNIHKQMMRGPAIAWRDVLLIGIGVTLGAAASIWAIIDSVA